MNNKILEIENKVNELIILANKEFKGWGEAHQIKMAKIHGMLDVLSELTGKVYIIAENGLNIK